MVFGCMNTQEKGVLLFKFTPDAIRKGTRDKWKGPSVVCSNFISLKIVLRWVAQTRNKDKA